MSMRRITALLGLGALALGAAAWAGTGSTARAGGAAGRGAGEGALFAGGQYHPGVRILHPGVRILHLAGPHYATTESSNWSGYDLGLLAQAKIFTAISAQWTVPTATAHMKGQAEDSATWIGIGGGCVDSGCAATDATLVQAGTDQDVDAAGHGSYQSWWEIIPLPEVTAPLAVAPGNRITVSLSEPTLGEWIISMRNDTTHRSFQTTVPYTSDYSSAELIEETPLEVGASSAMLPLPNLGHVQFSDATVNGKAADLVTSEEMELVGGSNGTTVLARPSSPDPSRTSFYDCSYATTCAAPRPAR